MKAQDALFFFTVFSLLIVRRPIVFVYAGLTCLLLSIPLFATWTFFTAQRLTWYSAGFFLLFLISSIRESFRVK